MCKIIVDELPFGPALITGENHQLSKQINDVITNDFSVDHVPLILIDDDNMMNQVAMLLISLQEKI